MQSVKRNFTRYSGLEQTALEYLVKSDTPIQQPFLKELWKELFGRYFNEGRKFNLYRLLKEKHAYFAYTIRLELQRPDVEIPDVHIEDFMVRLLEFIEYVDREVLTRKVEFDWELHELEGIRDMLDRIRELKIRDQNLRQRINLFIDKINQARKTAQEKISLTVEAPEAQDATPSMNETKDAVVLAKMKHALMQQKLMHLDISMSKINKTQLISMLENFGAYYPEDQDKIMKTALRKYPMDIPHNLSLRAFADNLRFKVKQANMVVLLVEGLKYHKSDPDVLVSGGSMEDVLTWSIDWYASLQGATDDGIKSFALALSKSFADNGNANVEHTQPLKRWLYRLMQETYGLVRQYKGATLTDAMRCKVKSRARKYFLATPNIHYDKEQGVWVAEEPDDLVREISLLKHVYWLLYHVTDRDTEMVEYYGDAYSNKPGIKFSLDSEKFGRKSTSVPVEWRQMIRDYIEFLPSLKIDSTFMDHVGYQRNPWPENDRDMILDVITHRFLRHRLAPSEIEVWFRNDAVKEFLKKFFSLTRSVSSKEFSRMEDFYTTYLVESLLLFDFKEDRDMVEFFSLPWDFIRKMDAEKQGALLQKLKEERSHEYALIAEMYQGVGVDEFHEEFEWDDEFVGLSALEKWELLNHGFEVTGHYVKRHGYRTSIQGETTFLSPEEACAQFVIRFFKVNYSRR